MMDREVLRRLVEKWEQETVAPILKKAPERAETAETVSGIPLKRVYTGADLAPDADESLGLPGGRRRWAKCEGSRNYRRRCYGKHLARRLSS